MHKLFSTTRSGFSLLEVVIYVTLFSLVSTMTLNIMFQTVSAFNNLRISRDINDSSVKIMERLTRDIKSATSVNQANSTFNTSPGMLTLETIDKDGGVLWVQYILDGDALHLREADSLANLALPGSDKGSLLSSQTSVSGVLFNYISAGSAEAVKIDLHITASRGKISDTDHFYDTVIARGTY